MRFTASFLAALLAFTTFPACPAYAAQADGAVTIDGGGLIVLASIHGRIPVDNEKFARLYEGYRAASDEFARRRIMREVINPAIASRVKAIESAKRFRLSVGYFVFEEYDFSQRGFPLSHFTQEKQMLRQGFAEMLAVGPRLMKIDRNGGWIFNEGYIGGSSIVSDNATVVLVTFADKPSMVFVPEAKAEQIAKAIRSMPSNTFIRAEIIASVDRVYDKTSPGSKTQRVVVLKAHQMKFVLERIEAGKLKPLSTLWTTALSSAKPQVVAVPDKKSIPVGPWEISAWEGAEKDKVLDATYKRLASLTADVERPAPFYRDSELFPISSAEAFPLVREFLEKEYKPGFTKEVTPSPLPISDASRGELLSGRSQSFLTISQTAVVISPVIVKGVPHSFIAINSFSLYNRHRDGNFVQGDSPESAAKWEMSQIRKRIKKALKKKR